MKRPFAAYQGAEPYVFVCYAHDDAENVYPDIQRLHEGGVGIWYDEGISPGMRWSDELARALSNASLVLFFCTPQSVKSKHCQDEVNFALDEDRSLLVIQDGPVDLPPGLRLRLGAHQSILKHDLTAEQFADKLTSAIRRHVTTAPQSEPEIRKTPQPAGLQIRSAHNPQTNPPLLRKNSICVLPFINMSGDAEQEYFSDGMSEDIITDLSKVSALFVIARNTAFTFKAKSVDVPQVAQQLNVSYVLEGSVRKAGGRVRITAQLIDGATGGHVWAERYDRDLTDIFALQDEIAEAIVTALKLKLLPEEKQQIERRGTTNLEAYDLYLRGTRPVFTPDERVAQIALLETATRLAPDYADAWGALAATRGFWRYSRPYAERDEIAAVVTVEAERALALDSHNSDAISAQLYLLPRFGRFKEADTLTSFMLNNASSYLAFDRRAGHLESVGRIRAAIELAQRAYEIDPLNAAVSNNFGAVLYFGGRYAESRQILEAALARWPDSHFIARNLIFLCVHTQDWARVDALLAAERLAQFPLREFERGILGFASIMRDPSPQSRHRPIEAAQRRFDASGYADFGQLQLAAHVGALDEAHTIAAQARFGPAGDDHDQMGFPAYWTGVLFNSIYPEFRRDPRFVKLCARLGLVDHWLTTQHWPDCVDEVAPYYDFKAECEKVAAGPPLPPANSFWS